MTLLFCIISTGSSYCWVTSISERGWYNMSTYETLSLMIAFGVLIVMIIGTKNSHLPPKANVTIFWVKILRKPLTGANCLFCTFIINQFWFICQSRFFSAFLAFFIYIFIQSYWNVPEHIAMTNENDLYIILMLMTSKLFLQLIFESFRCFADNKAPANCLLLRMNISKYSKCFLPALCSFV